MIGDFFAFEVSNGFDPAGFGHKQAVSAGRSVERPDELDRHALSQRGDRYVNRSSHTLNLLGNDGLFAGADILDRLDLHVEALGLEHAFFCCDKQGAITVPWRIGDDDRFSFGGRLRRFGRFRFAAASHDDDQHQDC